MKIELQEPYASRYSNGYLRVDEYGRGRVDLVNSRADRTTVSYARYLVETSIGEFIPSGYEVDHKDTDCSNDDLSNLQVLTREEHILKTSKERTGKTILILKCAHCGIEFKREKRQIKVDSVATFCSRSCNGKHNSCLTLNLVAKPVTEDKLLKIKELASQGLSGYKISKIVGVSANTVRKYMKTFVSS